MSFDLFAYRKLQDTAADCEDRCDQIEREMRDPKAAERFALKQSQALWTRWRDLRWSLRTS